ncbi:hypothetical protein CWB96_00265 [Pseudoalteromonas citrea]|uniref:Uncharacterized protein n=1 Tax=Pseudoalteromonas citrea TaxID=43655 RepID=A0A5S3XW58_9GAMM|nr:hypothetical protein [Pseudoalteromonas citrea]TMP46300.1 hypothetical protein CWB97_02260 [Pseudoalteromonas citrea]TMP63076.1 hypothetical protein CWB96_00265 [Pseudoalteromonas citrea]
MASESQDYTGVLAVAYETLPALKSGPARFSSSDSSLMLAAKLHYAYWFATSDSELDVLAQSLRGAKRKQELMGLLHQWANAVSKVFDQVVDWENISGFDKEFSNFPTKSQATDDNPMPVLSEVLVSISSTQQLPSVLIDMSADIARFLFPDSDAFLANAFPARLEPKLVDNDEQHILDAIDGKYEVISTIDIPMQEVVTEADSLKKSVEKTKKLRKIARVENGHGAMIRIVRHMLILDPRASKDLISAVLNLLDIKYSAAALPAKISDARKMLQYMGDLGLVDEVLLGSYTSMESIAQFDENLSIIDAQEIDKLIASLDFAQVQRRT